MNFEERLAAVGNHLLRELRDEFPGWNIQREDGRWTAIRSGWGALYAQSAAELRERLRRIVRRGYQGNEP